MASNTRRPIGWSPEEAEEAHGEWIRRGLPLSLFRQLLDVDPSASRKAKTEITGLIEKAADQQSTHFEPDCGDNSPILMENDEREIWLDQIELSNFLQFKHALIHLRYDCTRPVVIIEGPNGYGKSALIHAVRFALTGERERRDRSLR